MIATHHPIVWNGSRLCKNKFLEPEMKESILGPVIAATMIRPRDHPDSIVAQLLLVSAFLHSLDPFQTIGW